MPKKLKISSDQSFNYTTIGIACHMKDYRFTFFLNEQLGFRFKRMEDLVFGSGDDTRAYSFYYYENKEERKNYYLVSNYHEEGRLVPSEKGADFFLVVDDVLPSGMKKKIVSSIQKVRQVLAAYEVPANKAVNLDMIFQEIELHLLK